MFPLSAGNEPAKDIVKLSPHELSSVDRYVVNCQKYTSKTVSYGLSELSVVVEEEEQNGKGTEEEEAHTNNSNVHQKNDEKDADGEHDTEQHRKDDEFGGDGLG